MGLSEGLEKSSKPLIGNEQATTKARGLLGIDESRIEERKDGLMVLDTGAGESAKLLEFVFPDPGVVAGMPLKMEDIVEATSPEEPKAGGDLTDSLPFRFVLGEVGVGATDEV